MKNSHLLLLVIVLAVLVFFVLRRMQSTARDGGAAGGGGAGVFGVALTPDGFAPDKVAVINIGKAGEEPLRLEKHDGVWNLASTADSAWLVPADQAKVAALLRAVATLRGDQRSSSRSAHERFEVADANAVHLSMGAAAAPAAAPEPAESTAAAPAPAGEETAAEIVAEAAAETAPGASVVPAYRAAPEADLLDLRLGRAPEGLWSANYVRPAGGDATYVVASLRGVVGLDAAATPAAARRFWMDPVVLELDPEGLGSLELSSADRRLVFERRKPETAKPAADASAAGEGVAEVAGEIAEAVVPADPAEPGEAEGAVEEGEDGADGWRLVEGGWREGTDFAAPTLNRVLDALAGLRVDGVEPPGGVASGLFDRPAWRVAAAPSGDAAGAAPVTLSAVRAPAPATGFFARLDSRPGVVYQLSDSSAGALFPAGTEFFAVEPPRPVADGVRHVEYQRGAHAYSFEKKDGRWTSLVTPGYPPRGGAVNSLLESAAIWRPVDYADAAGRERFGFVAPRARVTFVGAEGSELLALGGERADGTCYVDAGGAQPLAASAADGRRLFPDFAELFDFRLCPDAPRLIRLARAGGEATVAREGTGDDDGEAAPTWRLTATDREAAVLTEEQVKPLLEAVNRLAGVDFQAPAATAPGGETAALPAPDMELHVQADEGRSVQVALGGIEGGMRPAKSADKVAVLVRAEDVEAVTAAFDALLQPAPAAAVEPESE